MSILYVKSFKNGCASSSVKTLTKAEQKAPETTLTKHKHFTRRKWDEHQNLIH